MKRLLFIIGIICITAGLLFAPAGTGPAGVGPAGRLIDTLFRVYDNSDSTKLLAFETSGIATGTTATITPIKTPSGPTDTGVAGSICWDSEYVYLWVATDTCRRLKPETWSVTVDTMIFEDGDTMVYENGDTMLYE